MENTPFGRYRLLRPLGQGGMGQVFRAYDTATDREVALKVLPPHLMDDPVFQQRFHRESHAAARLTDPHVVPIHGYGEIDGRLYLDMRLIDGRDLRSVLAEHGPINPVRAVSIIEQAAHALEAAHAIGLVHRDIKPSNILLADRDFVYLIDFGIAQDADATRITGTGAPIGTAAYMAPERFDTGQAEPSSDIYSLACVLYECLTGQPPFPGPAVQQQIAGHLIQPPPRPSIVEAGVPGAFDGVISKGMAKDPSDRYVTVTEFADAARAALDNQPQQAWWHATPAQLAPTRPAHSFELASAAIIPRSHPRSGKPDYRPSTFHDQPAQRSPAKFVMPGLIIMACAVLWLTFSIGWNVPIDIASWLLLALGFGLVAWRCRPHWHTVATTAWITCATALGCAYAIAYWWLYRLPEPPQPLWLLLYWAPVLALVAFGVTAHRPFGWWWSIPPPVAALLIAFFRLPALSDLPVDRAVAVPFFILGLAMVRASSPNHKANTGPDPDDRFQSCEESLEALREPPVGTAPNAVVTPPYAYLHEPVPDVESWPDTPVHGHPVPGDVTKHRIQLLPPMSYGAVQPGDLADPPPSVPAPQSPVSSTPPPPKLRFRKGIVVAAVLALLASVGLVGWSVIRNKYYVAEYVGKVTIMRGVPSILGMWSLWEPLHEPYQVPCVNDRNEITLIADEDTLVEDSQRRGCSLMELDYLRPSARAQVVSGLPTGTLDEAISQVNALARNSLLPLCPSPVQSSTEPGTDCRVNHP